MSFRRRPSLADTFLGMTINHPQTRMHDVCAKAAALANWRERGSL